MKKATLPFRHTPSRRSPSPCKWENPTAVIDAITALPIIYREVVLLNDLEELSYKEIAMLAVPIGTVMSRLSRGRNLLKQALEGRSPYAM